MSCAGIFEETKKRNVCVFLQTICSPTKYFYSDFVGVLKSLFCFCQYFLVGFRPLVTSLKKRMLKVPKCPTRIEEEEKKKKDSVLNIVHALQRYPQMENIRIVVFIELSHQNMLFFSRKKNESERCNFFATT